MWATSGTLPKNLDELYSYVLGPIVDREAWRKQGHGEWPDILSTLAFKIMTEKRPFDPRKDYLPEELKPELATRKLLVERGEVVEFRHDRVRAYLAARHFTLWSRKILADETMLVDAISSFIWRSNTTQIKRGSCCLCCSRRIWMLRSV